MFDTLLLLAAGLLGGVINSIAGGGSFITFPALLLVGVPPIAANASNTFAACAGYISGTWALRSEITTPRKKLVVLSVLSAIGGGLGAYLLTLTDDRSFEAAIPWLLLFATLLFAFGSQINQALQNWSQKRPHLGLAHIILMQLLFIGVSVYGGFFNAGLGIIILSYLSLAGHQQINEMNGLKLLFSTTISLCAIVLFLFNDLVAWRETSAVLVGTLIGGYLAGHLSKRLPQQLVRKAILFASVGITAYFFLTN
jgi:uncharacterized membrane protein YfcA